MVLTTKEFIPIFALALVARAVPAGAAERADGPETRPAAHPSGAVVLRSADEAVALARRENADLAAAVHDVEAARAGLVTAEIAGRFNPEIEASVGRRFLPPEGDEPARDVTEWGIGISREYEIAGQRGLRLDLARLEVEAAVTASEARAREIEMAVREAYARAQAAVHRAAFAADAERIRRDLAAAARVRFEAGDAARIEVSLADVEAARAVSERLAADREARAALSDLRRAIGLPAGAAIALEDDSHAGVEDRPAPAAEALVPVALRARRDLAAARLGERLGEARSRLALAEGRPNVRLGAAYEREEGAQDIVRAGVGIPLPLVNRNRGEAARFRAEAEAARLRAEALERRIAEEIRSAADAVTAARGRLAVLEERVLAADENLLLLEEAYREGKVGLAEVVVLQTEALETRRAAHETLHELIEAWLALEAAVGGEIPEERGDSR